MIVEPFKPEHFERLALQPAQEYARAYVTPHHLGILANEGPAYTISFGGQVLFCGGLIEDGPDRGMLWSYIAHDAGKHFLRIHRSVMRFLEVYDRPLIGAACLTGFEQGWRWLEQLGFTWHKQLGPFGPARRPHDFFMRVRA